MEGPARRIPDVAAARYARSVAPVHTSPTRTIPRLSALQQTPPAPPPQQQQPGIVSIEHLRSTNRRNEYVIPPHKSQSKQPHREKVNNNVDRNIFDAGQTPTAIIRQPVSTPLPTSPGLKKESTLRVDDDAQAQQPCQDSIICSQCYRCRCQQCSQPRELPRRWICGKWECSAQRAVEVCSCLCCVKGLFYHCGKDDEAGASAADDPCAGCGQPYCRLRWTCMGLLALSCLPCLCLYWPLTGALHLCTCCYNKCSRRGCHCRRDKLPGSRRLLIDSESSST